MVRGAFFCIILAACAACSREVSESANNGAATNDLSAEAASHSSDAIQSGASGGLPDDRNMVGEGPIDPKSAQGAGQVLQRYAALLEQRRFAEARRLWSGAGDASGMSDAAFPQAFAKYAEIHAEVGAPGHMEGAAGSTYVQIPVRFYGRWKSGSSFSSVGSATLRRVNDVPGSTAEQRQWRIYRVEVQPPL